VKQGRAARLTRVLTAALKTTNSDINASSELNVELTRICAAEMAVRYAALCRKVHVCHCNSLGGAT